MKVLKAYLHRIVLLTMLVVATVSLPLPSEAQQISQSQAAAIAQRATGGQVLSVEFRGSVWRVKVLIDGANVRIVNVDAQTGNVK